MIDKCLFSIELYITTFTYHKCNYWKPATMVVILNRPVRRGVTSWVWVSRDVPSLWVSFGGTPITRPGVIVPKSPPPPPPLLFFEKKKTSQLVHWNSVNYQILKYWILYIRTSFFSKLYAIKGLVRRLYQSLFISILIQKQNSLSLKRSKHFLIAFIQSRYTTYLIT